MINISLVLALFGPKVLKTGEILIMLIDLGGSAVGQGGHKSPKR